jgi:hypothetical protein
MERSEMQRLQRLIDREVKARFPTALSRPRRSTGEHATTAV